MDFPWYPSENARWMPPGIHQRMLWWTPAAPFPRPVLRKYAFWCSCWYATDIDFLAGTPSVAAPQQDRVCARPTVTASYDSSRVGAGPLPVGSRAAPMVGALRSWVSAGGAHTESDRPRWRITARRNVPAPPARLEDNKHLDIDGCDFGASV